MVANLIAQGVEDFQQRPGVDDRVEEILRLMREATRRCCGFGCYCSDWRNTDWTVT